MAAREACETWRAARIAAVFSIAGALVPTVALTQDVRPEAPRVLRVGLTHPTKTVAAAARVARAGDVIEIEAGEYRGDVAVWTQSTLTIRGVNGRARLVADGKAAEAKAIWVVRGGTIRVENISFSGTRVPHKNGAGIRLERGRLAVRNCVFADNENGILTGNDPGVELDVEDSEFTENGAGDGYSHGLYAGTIKRLTVRGSWFRQGRVGHLVKSRAAESRILYNRIADEASGTSSYELEFPTGGQAIVIGNVVQQGPLTQNPALVSFGAEGYKWPRNALFLAHNTLVSDLPKDGIFAVAWPGAASVVAINNLLVGEGALKLDVPARLANNRTVTRSEFALPERFDFRLKSSAKAVGAATDPGAAEGVLLRPTREYRHPASSVAVPTSRRLNPGAFQSVAR